MGSHKTKEQLEIELKNKGKDLEDARAELKALREGNKKLADQFYDYRNKLVKVRKELADAIEKRDSFKVELEGVRGALKRESELREHAENENATLKALSDDLEKQRRELEQKLVQEQNVAMVQEARATDLERQLRRKTEDCGDWMDRAFKAEKERDDLKKEWRELKENFEKAARKNDELQNEVNKLQHRWTSEPHPKDELLGRTIEEWQELNEILAKYNINDSGSLDDKLLFLEAFHQVLKKRNMIGPLDLDKRLSQSCPEEYMKVFSKYGIDSAEKLDQVLEKWFKVRQCSIILRNNIPYLGNIADFIKELA